MTATTEDMCSCFLLFCILVVNIATAAELGKSKSQPFGYNWGTNAKIHGAYKEAMKAEADRRRRNKPWWV